MEEQERSSTGLEDNVAGFLCYLFGFLSGIVFLIVEKRSAFVKFHARQSTITFLILLVVLILLGWVPGIGLLVWLASLFLWVFLIIKALQGKRYLMPIIGRMAEKKSE